MYDSMEDLEKVADALESTKRAAYNTAVQVASKMHDETLALRDAGGGFVSNTSHHTIVENSWLAKPMLIKCLNLKGSRELAKFLTSMLRGKGYET